MKYQTTFSSERLYGLDPAKQTVLDEAMAAFNKCRLSAYNMQFDLDYNGKESDQSVFMTMSEKYGMNTYWTNSAVNLGVGAYDSQKEALKLNLGELSEKQKAVKKKLSTAEKRAAGLRTSLAKLDIYGEKLASNPGFHKPVKINSFNGARICGYEVTIIHKKRKQETAETVGLYKFKYEYLIPELHRWENKVSHFTYRLNNLNTKIENIQKLHKISFHRDDKSLNYNSFALSGRADNTEYKNWAVKTTSLGSDTFNFDFMMPDGKYHIKLDNVHFPYYGEILEKALSPYAKMPVCFGIDKRTDRYREVYYQVKVSLDLAKVRNALSDTSLGAIGIDLNVGHVDYAETDSCGNLINKGVIPYRVDGTSEENALSLNAALRKIGSLAQKVGKPIVIEKLDMKHKKWRSLYRDPVGNRCLHLFPYARYTRMIQYIALENGIGIIEVSPAFTSAIGTLKYAADRKIPSHIAAALVIARRGMGYGERIPDKYRYYTNSKKSEWSNWSSLNKLNASLIKEKYEHPYTRHYKNVVLIKPPVHLDLYSTEPTF